LSEKLRVRSKSEASIERYETNIKKIAKLKEDNKEIIFALG